ncbi:potassium transporter Trk [Microbacterium oleivorans]|uniref:Potassium transporter Trk n=1 Tax=Microbacterium oleivorans TaxID=273677 RepID=A0A7D5IPN4_9MICO|nr:potassium transporter Trk [Microbacterium oleivorans]QLD11739.1 potassium transporter Trk [Microbacterium oleivorans]
MAEQITERVESARVRRVPKYSVFLLLGAAAGIIAALALTFGVSDDGVSVSTGLEYSAGQVFGFIALGAIPLGMALGGVVALILDRSARRRSREVRIVHERVRTSDDV